MTEPADPPDPDSSPDPAAELVREQDRLRHARACLARMRERAGTLRAAGGDRVSDEYLAYALHQRVAALTDDPSTPLFFGRVDHSDPPERFYVGRRHVLDERGDPVVIDWRAPLSTAFYRATPGDPMGLALRRRFGFAAGRLTAYEDEHLRTGGPGPTSRILLEEIERPRVGPMRDIVATIQPEQDELVRAPVDHTVCVQGAPGTGKTAVGLHRAAFLLYTHRERLHRAGVLVIGPNRAFLRYISAVLPALGELDVEHATLAELVAHVPVRGTDPDDVAALKGDARLAEVLRRALHRQLREPAEPLVVDAHGRRVRVPVEELAAACARVLAAGNRHEGARALLHRRYADLVARRLEQYGGEPPTDRQVDALARCRAVRDAVARVWPAVDPRALVARLLGEPDLLAAAADGLLADDEQRLLRWPHRTARLSAARWSLGDAVLVDEAADLLERTPSRGHVIVDEAQDLSPMQCRAIGRRCETGSATLLGDVAQATTPWAAGGWAQTLAHLGKPDAAVHELTTGYRVPQEVLAFASRLLPYAAPGMTAATSLRRSPGTLTVTAAADLPAGVAAAVAAALVEEGSVGVVAADEHLPPLRRALDRAGIDHAGADEGLDAARVTVVGAAQAKGLEFDTVVVAEPAAIARGARAYQLLYVALTRAVSRLVVVHADPLPGPLAT